MKEMVVRNVQRCTKIVEEIHTERASCWFVYIIGYDARYIQCQIRTVFCSPYYGHINLLSICIVCALSVLQLVVIRCCHFSVQQNCSIIYDEIIVVYSVYAYGGSLQAVKTKSSLYQSHLTTLEPLASRFWNTPCG